MSCLDARLSAKRKRAAMNNNLSYHETDRLIPRVKTRDSGIELLRIAAMFLILAHHYVYLNASSILNVPMGPTRFIMHFFLVGAGKVGVVIFFAITAWFLLDGSHSLRKNCRSAWILDRQVLFYSVVITAVSGLLGSGGVRHWLSPSSRFRLAYGGIQLAMSCSC